MNKDQEAELKIDQLVNDFIKKWLPNYYPHLVDTDENDGERLRNSLKSILSQEITKSKRETIEQVKDILEEMVPRYTERDILLISGTKEKMLARLNNNKLDAILRKIDHLSSQEGDK